jgi:hypothetical protein
LQLLEERDQAKAEVERLREERDRLDQALMIAAVRLFGDEVGIDGAQGVYDELLALAGVSE